MTRIPTVALIALALIAGPAAARNAGPRDDDPYASKSVLYRAASCGKARTFVASVYVSSLTEALRDGGPYTVFVPTDQAFANLPEEAVEDLLKPENEKKLAEILKYHIVKGRLGTADFEWDSRPRTLQGGRLMIASNGKGTGVDEATIVASDLNARNGVVHLIDRVLMPSPPDILDVAAEAGDFSILLTCLKATGLDETLRTSGPFTVFAPTDEAFRKLGEPAIRKLLEDRGTLAEILKFHVAAGANTAKALASSRSLDTIGGGMLRVGSDDHGLTVANGRVTKADVACGNGIIHVVDAVLIPPYLGKKPEGHDERDLVATAKAAGFKTLLAAAEAAGLVEALKGDGPLTVFAPTDEAFAKLGHDKLEELLTTENRDALAAILKYHVVKGKLTAREAVSAGTAKTLQGGKVKARIRDGRLFLNDSAVVATDVEASNGLIHVIDAVLIPDHH